VSLPAGSRLGPYEILAKVGEGGMGDVYRARDTRLDRTVAIKIVRADFGERFEREAKSISALNHPNICTLHDVGRLRAEGASAGASASQGPEVSFLVMEFVEGAPISGPLSVGDVIKLGVQICDALNAAHQKGIVHRDLKPANILATKAGIKLLDFGLAKLQQPATSQASEQATVAALTGAHTIIGTPQYMAPEQIEGRDADVRTDIFALGCVLYELVTGKRAFEGKTASSIMAAILATEPRKPSELVPVTPPMLEWIILRCLEKDPDARWQSAHDVGLQLRWVADHRDVVRHEIVATKLSPRPYVIGAAAGILLTAVTGALWLNNRAVAPASTPQGSSGPIAFTLRLPDKVTLEDSFEHSSVTLSPDGRTIAFIGIGSDRTSAIYLRRLDQTEAIKVAGSEGGGGPFFSPDSKWIGFSRFPRLRKVPVGGGVPVDIVDVPGGVRGAVWLADDTVVYSTPTGGLLRVPAGGGTAVALTNLDAAKNEKTHRTMLALPGGKAVVFVIGSNEIGTYDDGRIVALTLDTKQITELAKGYAPVYSPTGHLLYVRDATVFAVPLDPVTLKTGGSPLQILTNIACQPNYGAATFDVSADGILAYAQGGDRSERGAITAVDRLGNIEALPGQDRNFTDVRVSPDGKRLGALISGANNSLWAFDIGKSQPTRITSRYDIEQFAWSADGSRLTYWGGADLRSIRSDGSGGDEVLISAAEAAGRSIQPVKWSSDGQTLALTVHTGKSNDIGTYSSSTKKLTMVVESRFDEEAADLSPDGRWLLYFSDENQTGRPVLFVRDLTSSAKWPVPGDASQWAQWTKAGRELLYFARGMEAVPFTPGVPPVFGKPETLLPRVKPTDLENANLPSAAPDGSRFYASVAKPLPPVTEIKVVTNWAQDLAKNWR
jgi:serine/threonine protein kinase/Tol biopolymer transport system component